jgi:hypothetical protein
MIQKSAKPALAPKDDPFTDEEGRYSITTYKTIYHKVVNDFSNDFATRLQSTRTKRRKVFDKMDRYVEYVEQFLAEHEEFIEEKIQQILEKSKMDYGKWKTDQQYHLERDMDFMIYVNSLPVELKKHIAPQKKVENSQLKDILNYQNSFMKDLLDKAEELSEYLTHKEEVTFLINERIQDSIFLKFQFEEEDYMYVLDDILAKADDCEGEEKEIALLFVQCMEQFNSIL